MGEVVLAAKVAHVPSIVTAEPGGDRVGKCNGEALMVDAHMLFGLLQFHLDRGTVGQAQWLSSTALWHPASSSRVTPPNIHSLSRAWP